MKNLVYLMLAAVSGAPIPACTQGRPEVAMPGPSLNGLSQDAVDPAQAPMALLKNVVPTQTVNLKDGDKYVLNVGAAKQDFSGTILERYAYNGSIPGPLIRVKQGTSIKLKLANDIPMGTTLHSHGVRLDFHFDGPTSLQNPVMKGETFTHIIKFPDAGIFWYHPHAREDLQQDMGLAGNYLVEPRDPSYWNPVDREEVLMLDDVRVKDPVSYPGDASNFALMGRFGDTFLVNGQVHPVLHARPGEVVRFFLTNAANARTFRIKFADASMKLVGGDMGRLEQEMKADVITLSPGERGVVEVQFARAGKTGLVHASPDKQTELASVIVDGPRSDSHAARIFSRLRSNSEVVQETSAFLEGAAKAPVKTLELRLARNGMGAGMMGMGQGGNHHSMGKMTSMMEGRGKSDKTSLESAGLSDAPWAPDANTIEWEDEMPAMNRQSTSKEMRWEIVDGDGRVNENIRWVLNRGEPVRIRIRNPDSGLHPMQHPIHIHGQRFLIASVNGKSSRNLVWKDTVLVGRGDTTEIVLDPSNPGKWMLHCHISEHLTTGMSFDFDVK